VLVNNELQNRSKCQHNSLAEGIVSAPGASGQPVGWAYCYNNPPYFMQAGERGNIRTGHLERCALDMIMNS
jgi:hypothetical protein